MSRYILTRVIWILIILIAILTLNFVLLKLAPSYPPITKEGRSVYFNKMASDGYIGIRLVTDKKEMQEIRERVPREQKLINTSYIIGNCYYEDKGELIRAYEPYPINRQYIAWVKNIITKWDWGLSTKVEVGRPVFDILKDRMPTTITINIFALIIYMPIGLTLGIIAALNKNKPIDNFISITTMIMISIPGFITMIVLIMIFGYHLNWVPTIFPPKDSVTSIRVLGFILPVVGMIFGPVAGLTRVTRAELNEVLTSEFVLLARTKGLTKKQAVIRHAMRNALVPLVPIMIGSFVGLLSGSVIIEILYSIPGTGNVYIKALAKNAYDYNLLLCCMAFYVSIGLFAVLLVDITYGLIDPRIRMGSKK